MACEVRPLVTWARLVERAGIMQRQEGNVARGREEQSERNRPAESTSRGSSRDERTGQEALRGDSQSRQGADALPGRGFFARASERRGYVRPRGASRDALNPSEDYDRLRGQGGGGHAARGFDSPGDRGYGGRSVRGYDRSWREGSGGYYGQGTGEFERQQRGEHGTSGGAYAGDWQNREARRRDAGPYTEGRAPHHLGLPADLRAGEGQWAQPGGYAELGQERGYEPGYESGEWAPGGDASVPLRMGYGDYGVRREPSQRETQRRGRWRREPVLARDIMTSSPRSVRPDASLREVARIMRDENTGIVPVCEADGRLLGVVTDRDIVMRTLASEESPAEATARDVMTDDVEAVTPDENLHDVVHLMGEHQVRRIPVVERDDRLVGIISMADVATRADYDEDLQDALEEISARRSFWSRLFR
jgi:CBS domain-containing protein